MAQIEGKAGGRSANIELNLVPFIDLMSVLITFLLLTAVWSQVSMIQLGSSIYSRKQENMPAPAPPPPESADISLRLDIKELGYRLVVGREVFNFPLKAGAVDFQSVIDRLKTVKEKYPTKSDAVITMAESLPYDNLIKGMDVLLMAGFGSISIATAEAE
jgi:biopolymer transport protein ExbD